MLSACPNLARPPAAPAPPAAAQGPALGAAVALRVIDLFRDEVERALQLPSASSPAFLWPFAPCDGAVKARTQPQAARHDDDANSEPPAHREAILRVGTPRPAGLL